MSEERIEKAINNAVFSTEMEGYIVDDTAKELCRKLLKKEISMEKYISFVKSSAGIDVYENSIRFSIILIWFLKNIF